MQKTLQNGWIPLQRNIQENFLHPLAQGRKFSEFEAYLDLLLNITHQEYKHRVNGQTIIVPQGAIAITSLSLSNRWKWCRERVSKYLKMLEKEQFVTLTKNNPKSRKSLTILKFNDNKAFRGRKNFQPASRATKGATTNQSHNNKINKINKIDNYLEIMKGN